MTSSLPIVIAFVSVCSASSVFRQMSPSFQKDCSAPRNRGDFCAQAEQTQMFYHSNGQCQPFLYNGCNGNGNRFSTAQECRDYCVTKISQPQNSAGLMRDSTNDQISAMKAACSAEYEVDSITPTQCTNVQQCPTGHQCTGGYCCGTAQYLCNLRYDSGKFVEGGAKSDKYFWTPQYKTCMRFSYYGTQGNGNNFPDYNSCMRLCGVLA